MEYQNSGLNDHGILYCVVARGSYIIASQCVKVENFNDVAKTYLVKMDHQARSSSSTIPSKVTYTQDNYLLHYSRRDDEGLVFLCIADENFPRKNAYDFMDILAKKLFDLFPNELKTYSKIVLSSMSSDFEPLIIAEIYRANREAVDPQPAEECLSEIKYCGDGDKTPIDSASSEVGVLTSSNAIKHKSLEGKRRERPGNPDKITKVKDEVANVIEIMTNNINAIIERGEKLDLLVDKTGELARTSGTFKQGCRTLAQKMWWQNRKMWIWIGLIALVLIYIVITVSCGGFAWPDCVG